MDIILEAWNTQDTFHISNDAQEGGRTKYGWKDHPETPPPRDPSCIQLQNPNTIIETQKCLLTGATYSCHLGDSAST